MKKIIQEIGTLFGKTLLVTTVIVLGIGLWGLLGLPGWAQGFGLLPAGYVFCKLTGESIPPVRRWLPFLLVLTLLSFLFGHFGPQVPESYRTAALLAFVLVASSLLGLIRSTPPSSPPKPPSSGQ